MRFEIHTKDLSAALSTCAKLISGAGIITTNVKITADDNDTLTFAATDGKTTITLTREAEVYESGTICAPAKMLLDIAKKLPHHGASVSVKGYTMSVKSGTYKANIACEDAARFPTAPDIARDATSATLDQCTMQQMFDAVRHAASKLDAGRAILMGTYIEIEQSTISMTALDGFRLATIRRPLQGDMGNPITAILPCDTLRLLDGLLSDNEGDTVDFISDGKHAIIALPNAQIQTALIMGQYIDYKQMIDKPSYDAEIVISRHALKSALERSLIIKEKLVKLEIADGDITLSSRAETSEASETLQTDRYKNAITIAFNAQLLIDALSAMDSDEVMLQFTTPVAPCRITPMGNREKVAAGERQISIVLPVRTQG